MYRTVFVLFLSVMLFFSTGVFAQTADELIQKNINARGGLDKLKAVKSIKMTGKMVGQGGMEAPFVFQQKRPNKLRVEFVVQGLTGIEAYDGETAWSLMPFMGSKDPQKMPEEQAKELASQADFDGPLVDYKEKGHSVEYLGKEDVEGTEAHKIKLTLKDGRVRYVFLDPEIGLEMKVTSLIKREGFEATVDSYLSDYKEVNGLIIPFAFEQKMKGQTMSQFTVEKVEMDVEISDDLFGMPAPSESQTQPSNQE